MGSKTVKFSWKTVGNQWKSRKMQDFTMNACVWSKIKYVIKSAINDNVGVEVLRWASNCIVWLKNAKKLYAWKTKDSRWSPLLGRVVNLLYSKRIVFLYVRPPDESELRSCRPAPRSLIEKKWPLSDRGWESYCRIILIYDLEIIM